MNRAWTGRVGGLVTAGLIMVLAAAGCATTSGGTVPSTSASSPPPSDASTGPSSPGTDLPTLKPPSAPPTTPTDNLPTDVVVGTVTIAGTGPCYGMETNDGKQVALYGGDGVRLARGDTIRVTVEPLLLMIYCGPGQHYSIVKLEIVR